MGVAKAKKARIRRWMDHLERGGAHVAGFERGSRGYEAALRSVIGQYSDREFEEMFPTSSGEDKT
ncbi:MAG: hypothetical protein Q8L23_01495 [Caulobacter sp.]|nr:hypothetical protein [Caulobacter sp.]